MIANDEWRMLSEPQRALVESHIEWRTTARAEQLPGFDDWSYWLALCGRGWGKTRACAEFIAWQGGSQPGIRIAVVAATWGDGRDVCVEGESGLLGVLPHICVRAWNRSLGELILWNDTHIKLFSGEQPDRLRGFQHHLAWCDELAAWERPETFDQLMFTMRLGTDPRIIIATTPRPTPIVRSLLANPRTKVVRGSTFENAGNLAGSSIEELRRKYEGTRLGRQELYAEVLDDVPGALWTRDMIDVARKPVDLPDMRRIVVSIDPSGARDENDDDADEIGIVVAGKGVDGRAYVLADRSCRLSPLGWAQRAVAAYREFNADCIIAERNFGGAMVEHTLRTVDRTVKYQEVVASRGKVVRAEPVAAFYEQGLVTHTGKLDMLEDQMCMFTSDGYLGDGSPDRVDALVWAISHLLEMRPPMIISKELLARTSPIARRF